MPSSKKPRKPHNRAKFRHTINRPALTDSAAVFDPIVQALEQMRSGYVDATVEGVEIFRNRAAGEAYELLPALRGWIAVWERIAERTGRTIQLNHIRKLLKRLEYGVPVCDLDITHAMAEIAGCRRVFLTTDVATLKSCATTEMIAIKCSRLRLHANIA